MATKNKTKTKRNLKGKRRLNKTQRIFWITLVIFLLPFIILAWILLSAARDTGTPIIGDRYVDDHDPAITETQLSTIESQVSTLDGVEDADVRLVTGTVRVYLDITDTADADTATYVAGQAYTVVANVLDINTYFSQSNGMKMYDLEIHVYNLDSDRDSDSFVYVIETKTSSMTDPIVQVVSEPIDAELAEELRQDVENRNNPTPTPEMTEEAETSDESSEVTEEDSTESQEG